MLQRSIAEGDTLLMFGYNEREWRIKGDAWSATGDPDDKEACAENPAGEWRARPEREGKTTL
jgi:hypothetical protein